MTRSVLTPVRSLRPATAADGGHPQPLPLVLAVLPLRTVVREPRVSPRHA